MTLQVRQAKQRFWVMHANLETMLIKLLSKSKNPVVRRMTQRPYSASLVNFFLLMPVALLLPSLMAWCCGSGGSLWRLLCAVHLIVQSCLQGCACMVQSSNNALV